MTTAKREDRIITKGPSLTVKILAPRPDLANRYPASVGWPSGNIAPRIYVLRRGVALKNVGYRLNDIGWRMTLKNVRDRLDDIGWRMTLKNIGYRLDDIGRRMTFKNVGHRLEFIGRSWALQDTGRNPVAVMAILSLSQ